jgi:PII-like signaling protein
VLGYHKLPHIRNNPDWWALELVDGFGSHVNCHEAKVFRTDHKILSLKEVVDSSHINQAYDRFVARSDKAMQW